MDHHGQVPRSERVSRRARRRIILQPVVANSFAEDDIDGGMLGSMPNRRTNVYPPASVAEVRWLVIDDHCGTTIQSARLKPNADLVAALEGAREHYIAEGWQVDELDRWQAVHAIKGSARLFIHLRAVEPGQSLIGHGTHLCGRAPGK